MIRHEEASGLGEPGLVDEQGHHRAGVPKPQRSRSRSFSRAPDAGLGIVGPRQVPKNPLTDDPCYASCFPCVRGKLAVVFTKVAGGCLHLRRSLEELAVSSGQHLLSALHPGEGFQQLRVPSIPYSFSRKRVMRPPHGAPPATSKTESGNCTTSEILESR